MNYIEELNKLNDMLADVMQQVRNVIKCEERDKDSYLDIPVVNDYLTEVRHIVVDMRYRAVNLAGQCLKA